MSGIAGIIFKMQMEMKKKVKRLEHALVVNPFDKKSASKVKERINDLDFNAVETSYDTMREIRE